MSVPIAVTVTGITLAIGLPLVAGATAVYQKEALHGATDNAALAAADALVGRTVRHAAEPCSAARRTVAAGEGAIESCIYDSSTGEVWITASRLTLFGRVRAQAHAGPPG